MTLLSKKLNTTGLSQIEIAEKVGVSQAYVSNVMAGKILGKKATDRFADAFGWDSYEIMRDFDFWNTPAIPPKEKIDNTHKANEIITRKKGGAKDGQSKVINDEDLFVNRATVIPVAGQAGLESAMYDDIMMSDLETEPYLLPRKLSGTYFKVEVNGDSMTDGSSDELKHGDWAYCRSLERRHWSEPLYTHKWRVWCFFHNFRGIIFKCIRNFDPETGELELYSLNPDKEQFPDFTINIKECSYVCNVVQKLTSY